MSRSKFKFKVPAPEGHVLARIKSLSQNEGTKVTEFKILKYLRQMITFQGADGKFCVRHVMPVVYALSAWTAAGLGIYAIRSGIIKFIPQEEGHTLEDRKERKRKLCLHVAEHLYKPENFIG